MIRKGACDAVRKTDEQGVYEADERAQPKTVDGRAGATCQCHQVYTQGIGMDGSGSETIPSQVRVLSQGESVFFGANYRVGTWPVYVSLG